MSQVKPVIELLRPSRTRSEDGARRVNIEQGFPDFQHNQWTIEGELERLGAFGRGAARAHGPRRWLAVSLLLPFVIPIAITAVLIVVRVIAS